MFERRAVCATESPNAQLCSGVFALLRNIRASGMGMLRKEPWRYAGQPHSVPVFLECSWASNDCERVLFIKCHIIWLSDGLTVESSSFD